MAPTKIRCGKCRQVLKNLEHGKCMYCGEALPENVRLSDEEARTLKADKYKKWREEKSSKNQWGKPTKTPGTKGEWGWDDFLQSGGFDGSGGDVGGGGG